mgnify:CR=1 FL=1
MQEAVRRTKALAQLVGCDSKANHAKMVDCLRKIDPQVLINQEQSVSNYSLNMEPFPPVIDGQFIIEEPEKMLENKVFKKCPMIIGTNANEGLTDMIEYIPELGLQENLFELDENQLNFSIIPRHVCRWINCRRYSDFYSFLTLSRKIRAVSISWKQYYVNYRLVVIL